MQQYTSHFPTSSVRVPLPHTPHRVSQPHFGAYTRTPPTSGRRRRLADPISASPIRAASGYGWTTHVHDEHAHNLYADTWEYDQEYPPSVEGRETFDAQDIRFNYRRRMRSESPSPLQSVLGAGMSQATPAYLDTQELQDEDEYDPDSYNHQPQEVLDVFAEGLEVAGDEVGSCAFIHVRTELTRIQIANILPRKTAPAARQKRKGVMRSTRISEQARQSKRRKTTSTILASAGSLSDQQDSSRTAPPAAVSDVWHSSSPASPLSRVQKPASPGDVSTTFSGILCVLNTFSRSRLS
jgi:hypothetical protein